MYSKDKCDRLLNLNRKPVGKVTLAVSNNFNTIKASQMFCNILVRVRQNSATTDAFAEVVRVTNHTGL